MKRILRQRWVVGISSLVSLSVYLALISVPVYSADDLIGAQSKLDDFLASRTMQKFTGTPVNINVRDVDVKDIIRLISDSSGFNVVVGEDVKGKLTLSLMGVPWDQALDVVLRSAQLGAERNDSVLRVVTLNTLTTEKQKEIDLKRTELLSARRVTRVFPISYADLTEIQGVLKAYITAQASVSGIGGSSGASALVQIDPRTNSIIIFDLPENVERMKKLIELLDTQTPQVLIEAKIVEASEQFAKNISGSIGIGSGLNSGSVQSILSTNGGNAGDALLGGVFQNGADVGKGSITGSTFGISPQFSVFGGARLNALLSFGENDQQLKVVASPKTVVLHKQKATITEGTPVLLPGATSIVGGASVNQPTVGSANINLDVTPTVTNDGNVLLKVDVSKDVPQTFAGQTAQTGIAKRNMTTQVIVESGSTLVMGGMYNLEQRENSGGFPFLRKIPILGVLFGSEQESTKRSEIFFFITPRVLNPRDAGINRGNT
ncbi:type IV pilus secretin PilQ [bacterium]|jgi:type IV pilus assembly protein PilQ|nr:type IV pilus secretin PilQ [bacterium]